MPSLTLSEKRESLEESLGNSSYVDFGNLNYNELNEKLESTSKTPSNSSGSQENVEVKDGSVGSKEDGENSEEIPGYWMSNVPSSDETLKLEDNEEFNSNEAEEQYYADENGKINLEIEVKKMNNDVEDGVKNIQGKEAFIALKCGEDLCQKVVEEFENELNALEDGLKDVPLENMNGKFCKKQKCDKGSAKEMEGLILKRKNKVAQIMLTNENREAVKKMKKQDEGNKRCCGHCCGSTTKFIFGILLVTLGVLSLIWTPLEIMMQERLRMTPGLPAYDWWAAPPDEVYLKMYVFNITNSEEFLAGEDTQLHFEEIGPIVYKEHLTHSNMTFNDNSTLTYVAKRWVEFLPEQNQHINMNATIVLPNIFYLGFASYLHNASHFAKMGFNLATGRYKTFITESIHNYMWNYTSPMVKFVKRFAPHLMPVDNMGMLQTIYHDFTDAATVYIGRRWGDSLFFGLDTFQGRSALPGDRRTCTDTVRGSTEGLLYPQRLTKNSSLLYWRKTLCKVMKLNYQDEFDMNGIHAYRFTLPSDIYHRTHEPNKTDCYASSPAMPDGFSDLSKCFFNFPMALSLPHFHGVPPAVFQNFSGFSYDPSKHSSYAIVDPVSGIPLESYARSQSNLVIRPLNGFSHKLMRFSNMTLPMFWAEYSQPTLPSYVWALLYLTNRVMPIFQIVLTTCLFLLGILLVVKAVIPHVRGCSDPSYETQSRLDRLARNTMSGDNQALKAMLKR